MKLTEREVKEFFVSCNNTAKDGIYHGEEPDFLDIREFAQKVADYVSHHEYHRGRKDEHKRLVEITESVNKDVANLLRSKREYAND